MPERISGIIHQVGADCIWRSCSAYSDDAEGGGGVQGAILATIAVFLPSFVFVALLNPLVPMMRKSRFFSAFLDGVNIATVAIILTICISLGRETISDWRTILIAILSLVMVFGYPKVNTVFIVIGSAALGYVLQFL